MASLKEHFPFHRLIILGLIGLWALLTINYLRNEEINFTTLEGRFGFQYLSNVPSAGILKGEIVFGTFISPYPNLGTVAVRFNTFARINNDGLIFRIRELSQDDWIYQSNYKTDQFQFNKLFPFGFPLIKNSNDRTYYFEIESTLGTLENSVTIAGKNPTLVSRHIYTARELFGNFKEMRFFMVTKIKNLVNTDFLYHTGTYLLPLIFYLFFLSSASSLITLLWSLLLLVALDVIFIDKTMDFFYGSIIMGWLLLVKKHRLTSQISASAALIIIPLALTDFVSHISSAPEKTLVWIYIFGLIATLQRLIELRQNKLQKSSVVTFWREFINYSRGELRPFAIMLLTITIETTKKVIIEGSETVADSIRVVMIGENYRKEVVAHASARTVQTIVDLAKLIRIGFYFVVSWQLWILVRKTDSDYLAFFRQYFDHDQEAKFFSITGWYLLIFYLAAGLALIKIQSYFRPKQKIVIAILSLFLIIGGAQLIFDRTTTFRHLTLIERLSSVEVLDPWTDVYVTGHNFGALPFIGKVLIDGKEQRIIRWFDDEVVFRTNPTTTTSGKLEVQNHNGQKSNQIDFIYRGNR